MGISMKINPKQNPKTNKTSSLFITFATFILLSAILLANLFSGYWNQTINKFVGLNPSTPITISLPLNI